MKRTTLILAIAALSVAAFAQSKVKVNISELTGGSNTSVQIKTTPVTTVQIAPSRSTVVSQLAPPNKNQEDNRGEPVPEPATMAVIGVGVAALLRRKKK